MQICWKTILSKKEIVSSILRLALKTNYLWKRIVSKFSKKGMCLKMNGKIHGFIADTVFLGRISFMTVKVLWILMNFLRRRIWVSYCHWYLSPDLFLNERNLQMRDYVGWEGSLKWIPTLPDVRILLAFLCVWELANLCAVQDLSAVTGIWLPFLSQIRYDLLAILISCKC